MTLQSLRCCIYDCAHLGGVEEEVDFLTPQSQSLVVRPWHLAFRPQAKARRSLDFSPQLGEHAVTLGGTSRYFGVHCARMKASTACGCGSGCYLVCLQIRTTKLEQIRYETARVPVPTQLGPGLFVSSTTGVSKHQDSLFLLEQGVSKQ